jgi:ribonuclease VapC
LDDFVRETQVLLEPVTVEQAKLAREAYRDFGKGRHRAGLNLGDCFAYALAKDKREPLLFKGDDFKLTDIEAAEF